MIRFHAARWCNLLSTGNDWIEINFEQSPTTLIVGKNGSGKSQVIEALSLCLFNKPFRKINKNQLVNTITGKGLLVEVGFTDGKHEYVVRRGIKPAVFEVLEDGTLWNQQDVKDMQERLEKVLGLNFKTFHQVVVLGSAEFKPFMQLAAHERRIVIEDLLDLQVFSAMNVILKDKVSTSNAAIKKAETDLALVEQRVRLQEKHLAQLQENHQAEIDEKLNKISGHEVVIETRRHAITEVTIPAAVAMPTGAEQRKTMQEMIRLRDQIDHKRLLVDKELQFFKTHDHCPTCKQKIAEDFRSEQIEKKAEACKEFEAGLAQLTAEHERFRVQVVEIDRALEAYRVERSKAEQTVAGFRQTISMHEGLIASLREQIASLKNRAVATVDSSALEADRAALAGGELALMQLKTDGGVMTAASHLLKDGGIKSLVIRQYVPVINKLINKYLASLEFMCNFDIDENFEETIKSRYRDDFSYESFSEGQKLRIDLAILFAWRALARMRNSSATNLLIFDEILDSSLDQDGIDELMKLIKQLTSDERVFIMSHRGDQLVDKFADVIRFELVRSFSKMSRETSTGG